MADDNASWYASLGLDDENIGMIQTKGWGDANSLIKSYRELEKYTGADKNDFVKIPKAADGETPDFSEVYSKLGRPDDASGYELTDSDFAKAARDVLFKAGITNSQAKQLEQWITDYTKSYQQSAEESMAQERELRNKASAEELKKEWGADSDKNYNIVENTRKDLGISDEAWDSMVESVGPKIAAQLMLRASEKSDTTQPLTGYNNAAGNETKEMAALKIAQMQSDPEIIRKLNEGDPKIEAEFKRLAALTVTGK